MQTAISRDAWRIKQVAFIALVRILWLFALYSKPPAVGVGKLLTRHGELAWLRKLFVPSSVAIDQNRGPFLMVQLSTQRLRFWAPLSITDVSRRSRSLSACLLRKSRPAFQIARHFDTGLFSGIASDLLLRIAPAQFSVSPSRSANSDAVITSVLRILPSRRTSVSAVTR